MVIAFPFTATGFAGEQGEEERSGASEAMRGGCTYVDEKRLDASHSSGFGFMHSLTAPAMR